MSEKNTKSSELDSMFERMKELNQQGLNWSQAFLEYKIENWPLKWGSDFQILIYGDFEPPNADLHFSSLDITIHHEKLENTLIQSTRCVLRATVNVGEKSVPAIIDAIRRINVLLGAWTLVEWGNGTLGWWSHITHNSNKGAIIKLEHEYLDQAIYSVINLPNKLRQKVDAALYWVREPQNLNIECHRNNLLRIYVSYWNAFECLIEAINILYPLPKLSNIEKQRQLDAFIKAKNGKLTSDDIEKCYKDIVNPGFVGKASHALKVCFPEEAGMYIDECFQILDHRNRLYNIRNAINHGNIDAENPEELMRIDSRLSRLWMIVWKIFSKIINFPGPVDTRKSL